MSPVWILVVVLVVLLLTAGPYTGWHTYGYYPSGIVGIVLIILLILVFFGRL